MYSTCTISANTMHSPDWWQHATPSYSFHHESMNTWVHNTACLSNFECSLESVHVHVRCICGAGVWRCVHAATPMYMYSVHISLAYQLCVWSHQHIASLQERSTAECLSVGEIGGGREGGRETITCTCTADAHTHITHVMPIVNVPLSSLPSSPLYMYMPGSYIRTVVA